MDEIKQVTQKPKLKKYFSAQKVEELIDFLQIIGEDFKITSFHKDCRDPKDNFLLDLIPVSSADFLVTGDKDLLALDPFMTTAIVSPDVFRMNYLSLL